MKTMAVICEYNPFHNGHAYQLATHRKELEADGIIAVMSGQFVQRGAPAVCDKWTRAKMALAGGCDLVLELPAIYATASAERFASGAVSLIEQLKIVDYLSFGSECGCLDKLADIADLLLSPGFHNRVETALKRGASYPSARTEVISESLGKEYAALLSTPNNTLGIEYLKALKKLRSRILPYTLRRAVGSGRFATASDIRSMLVSGNDATSLLPTSTSEILSQTEIFSGGAALDHIITYLFRTLTLEQLRRIPDMTEGLEHRFITAAAKYHTFEDIISAVKTKRYTQTRLNRIIINLLLGITQEDILIEPQYIRVLGMNETGRSILRAMKKKVSIPIIVKTADAKLTTSHAKRMFEIDVKASDIYALLTQKRGAADYTTSPVIV